jgi:hypothetical protein
MLALGSMILPATAGADTAVKAPPGFKTVKVKKAGFSIAIPKDWRTLNATSKTASDLLENLQEAAPELADQLPAEVEDLAAQNIVLLSYAAAPHEGFTANVNVLFLPDETDLPTLDELAPVVRSIAEPGIGLTETTLAGQDAVRASYRVVSGTISARLLQYAFIGPGGLLQFTFTEGENDTTRDDFEAMADSIKLLKR